MTLVGNVGALACLKVKVWSKYKADITRNCEPIYNTPTLWPILNKKEHIFIYKYVCKSYISLTIRL